MSYTAWVNLSPPQLVQPRTWTHLTFTDADAGIAGLTQMEVADGHEFFTAQLYLPNLPAPSKVSVLTVSGETVRLVLPGQRPTFLKVRFARYLAEPEEGTGRMIDNTAWDAKAVACEAEDWETLSTMFVATDPAKFTLGVDLYHNAKVPISVGTRIFKGLAPNDDVRVTFEGRLNP